MLKCQGKLDNALELIHTDKEAGADFPKIQTYTADTLTLDCDNAYFQIKVCLFGGTNFNINSKNLILHGNGIKR